MGCEEEEDITEKDEEDSKERPLKGVSGFSQCSQGLLGIGDGGEREGLAVLHLGHQSVRALNGHHWECLGMGPLPGRVLDIVGKTALVSFLGVRI